VRVGRFETRARIAGGASGEVYAAEDLETGRRVALKCLRLAASRPVDLLRREVRALERLDHPGVARIVAWEIEPERAWIATELVEGETLRQWIDREPAHGDGSPAAGDRRLRLVGALCDALA
jgi:serine/threonine protein kinase